MENKRIKLVCFDIDGVLTDGRAWIDQNGVESKAYSLTEIDALNDIQRLGFLIAAITGEKTTIVDVFRKRVMWDSFFDGCKDKEGALKELETQYDITRDAICYIGDGKYDVAAIRYAGLGVCPQNAIPEAKAAADVVLDGRGGESCVYELYSILKGNNNGTE